MCKAIHRKIMYTPEFSSSVAVLYFIQLVLHNRHLYFMKGQLRMLLYPDYRKVANYPKSNSN